jgi:hypothetical protein
MSYSPSIVLLVYVQTSIHRVITPGVFGAAIYGIYVREYIITYFVLQMFQGSRQESILRLATLFLAGEAVGLISSKP